MGRVVVSCKEGVIGRGRRVCLAPALSHNTNVILYSKIEGGRCPAFPASLTLRMAAEMMGGASLVWIHFGDQHNDE